MTHTWRDAAADHAETLWRRLLSPSIDVAKQQLWLVLKGVTQGQREPTVEEVTRCYLRLRDELRAKALAAPEGHHPASEPPP